MNRWKFLIGMDSRGISWQKIPVVVSYIKINVNGLKTVIGVGDANNKIALIFNGLMTVSECH